MLYPPIREKQKYHNTILVNELVQSGDNINKVRIVDHAISFDSKEKRTKYIKELPKLKLKIKDFKLFEPTDKDEQCTLELHIPSSLQNEAINKITDSLISQAEEYGGTYDGWGSEITK